MTTESLKTEALAVISARERYFCEDKSPLPLYDNHIAYYNWQDSLIETPSDPETGLPSCIAPSLTLPKVLKRGEPNFALLADWNHQFPKSEIKYGNNPVITGLAAAALRDLRLQWVDYGQHHYVYNKFFKGPKQPPTSQELFKTLVMGLAGSIPEVAIDLSGDSLKQVNLSPAERKKLITSGQVRSACVQRVYSYLFQYTFMQQTDHIRFVELEEFLKTTNYQRRLYLGHAIAAKMVERAVEPIEPIYHSKRRSRELSERAPNNPRDFVKSHLTTSKFGPVINELQRVLASRRREVMTYAT